MLRTRAVRSFSRLASWTVSLLLNKQVLHNFLHRKKQRRVSLSNATERVRSGLSERASGENDPTPN
eukprot:5242598-Pyramimonas_sp.AAC.1